MDTNARTQQREPLICSDMKRSIRSRLVALMILIAFTSNAAWELAQCRLYVLSAHGLFASHVWGCLLGAAGDVVLLALSFLATAAAVKSLRWPLRPHFALPTALFVAIGLVATVAVERWAQSTGLWSYAETMPTVVGVGVAPALQWVVIPMLMVWLVRAIQPGGRGAPRALAQNA